DRLGLRYRSLGSSALAFGLSQGDVGTSVPRPHAAPLGVDRQAAGAHNLKLVSYNGAMQTEDSEVPVVAARATIADVARVAGVSQATAARLFHHRRHP